MPLQDTNPCSIPYKVLNVIASVNQGTPRDTVYSRGKGAHKQKSERYRLRFEFRRLTERQNCVLGSVRLIGGIKKRQPKRLSFFMVPVAGLEPARYRYRWILSPLRLPIPSHRHKLLNHSSTTILFLQLI